MRGSSFNIVERVGLVRSVYKSKATLRKPKPLTIIEHCMKIWMLIVVVALGQLSSYSQSTDLEQYVNWNLPTWVNNSFQENELDKSYEFVHLINPFLLRGDFNGDNSPDICVLIKEKISGKRGIAIFHGASNDYYIMGAGQSFENGGRFRVVRCMDG